MPLVMCCGTLGRRAVIDEQAGRQRLEGDDLLHARIGLREFGAAAGSGRGVEVDRVGHDAVFVVFQMHLDGVADANAQHRARDFAVERPIVVGRLVRQLALHLDGPQIDAHDLRRALADRRGHVGGVAA